MIYLLLAILCSVLLGFIFKLFPRFGVDSFQAIVFNYFTCVASATVHLGHLPFSVETPAKPWFPYALLLSVVFITGFNGAALTVRYFGVTVAQIMQKMSILLSVPFAMLAYGESAGWVKIVGIGLALASIILVNLPSKKSENEPKTNGTQWLLLAIPFFTWFLSAVIEVVFIRVQNEKMIEPGDVSFVSTVFGCAGLLGLGYAIFGWASGRMRFSWRNVLGGIALGIPNYGSMLFILLGLAQLEGSVFFPLCNVGIIVATTLGAVFIFHEKLSAVNWLGIVLAIAAIALISL